VQLRKTLSRRPIVQSSGLQAAGSSPANQLKQVIALELRALPLNVIGNSNGNVICSILTDKKCGPTKFGPPCIVGTACVVCGAESV